VWCKEYRHNRVYSVTHLLCLLTLVEFDESVLERISSLLVSNHLATHDCPESRKNELQIFISRDRVEFADKKHVLRRPDICKWQISNHFESQSRCSGSFLSSKAFFFFLGQRGQRVFIFCNAGRVIGWTDRGGRRLDKARRVRKRVVYAALMSFWRNQSKCTTHRESQRVVSAHL